MTGKLYLISPRKTAASVVIDSPQMHADHFLSKGLAAEEAGDDDSAFHFYELSLMQNPLSVKPRVNIGNLFLKRGMLNFAEVSYRLAIIADPSDALAKRNLGNCLFRCGATRYDEALAEYKASLVIEPNHPDSHYDLGVLYEHIAEFAGRAAEMDNAIRHYSLFLEYHRQKDADRAIRACWALKDIKEKRALKVL